MTLSTTKPSLAVLSAIVLNFATFATGELYHVYGTSVSVCGDASYPEPAGRICSGPVHKPPHGTVCPYKGDVAEEDCYKYLSSYDEYSAKCIAPEDAECRKLSTGAWGCVFPSVKCYELPCDTTEDPYVTTEDPYVTTEDPYVTTEDPYVTTEDPYVTTEDPYVTTEDPYVTTEDPYVTTEDPYVTTEDPYVTTEDPYVTTEDPYVTTEDPYVTTEDPYVTTEDPYVTTEDPYVTTEDPYVTTEDPYVTTEVPYVTTKVPYTPKPYPKNTVSVCMDATYPAKKSICSGPVSAGKPAGYKCPKKGDVAVARCYKYLKSYDEYQSKCIAPEDAECVPIFTGAFGCVFPSVGCRKTAPPTPYPSTAAPPTYAPKPYPTKPEEPKPYPTKPEEPKPYPTKPEEPASDDKVTASADDASVPKSSSTTTTASATTFLIGLSFLLAFN